MPLTHFRCPDGDLIKVDDCVSPKGCRMDSRCAATPYLRLVGYDREWRLSPSCAGNGPRYEYLRATMNYAASPESRAFAALGTGAHQQLSYYKFSDNVLSEEELSDDQMKGTADLLEEDEFKGGWHILTDYKTFGSFKIAKVLGIVSEKVEETILDDNGKPVILKSGKNKGKPKTKQKTVIKHDPAKEDRLDIELQINRYRIFFEQNGFPISRMVVQAIPRDGGTYVAKNRGIDKNIYLIPIKRMSNTDVLRYYQKLNEEILEAFKTGYIRKCDMWECWDRKRCESFCDVQYFCKEMSKKHNEKWGLI